MNGMGNSGDGAGAVTGETCGISTSAAGEAAGCSRLGGVLGTGCHCSTSGGVARTAAGMPVRTAAEAEGT